MKLHGFQWDQVWENREANFAKVRALLEPLETEPGDLLVFPEMYATGFTMNPELTAEDESSPGMAFLARVARERSVYVTAGVVRRGEDGVPRNETVVTGPDGRELFRQAKLHAFTPAGEERHHALGNSIAVWDWNGIKVAPFVCYDLRFPEIFRLAALAGAELFTVIASWPAKRAAHWRLLLQARAVENLAWVAGINRTGRDPNVDYAGGSLLVDAAGGVAAEGGDGEEVVSAEIDPSGIREWRAAFPALRDVRPEFFAREHQPF